jgi:hypothetical protein
MPMYGTKQLEKNPKKLEAPRHFLGFGLPVNLTEASARAGRGREAIEGKGLV